MSKGTFPTVQWGQPLIPHAHVIVRDGRGRVLDPTTIKITRRSSVSYLEAILADRQAMAEYIRRSLAKQL